MVLTCVVLNFMMLCLIVVDCVVWLDGWNCVVLYLYCVALYVFFLAGVDLCGVELCGVWLYCF